MHEDPMTEWGSRPKGPSAFSSSKSVAPGKHTHLLPTVEEKGAGYPHQVDEHDRAIIIATRGRAARQAGIGRLCDHDHPGGNAFAQHPPLLDQSSRPHDGEDRPRAEAETGREPPGSRGRSQDMAAADDRGQPHNQRGG